MQLHLDASQIPSNLSLVFKGFVKRCPVAALPELSVAVKGFRFDETRLRRYNEFCGFDANTLPLPYLFVATQPVQLILLTDKRLPVQPLGMIHLGVSFERFLAMTPAQAYDFTIRVGDQAETEKGLEFELIGEFYQGESLCARYISRCLMRQPQSGERRRRRRGARAPKTEYNWQQRASLALEPSVARGYAKLSGDFNPIHLHRLVSRPFGFDEPIAHGMYMVARMMSAAEGDILQASFDFKRPVPMPGRGHVEQDGEALRLANDAGKPLVEASLVMA